jgi:chromosome segregation ATPase
MKCRFQGDNSAEIAKAQALLEQCQTLLDDAIKKADAARASADAARAAEAEQKAALAEVQSQEDARNKKTQELTAKSEDMNTGVVARNKAKNELAQHLAEDPLPLRKAKITLEAANRKAEKARAAAEADEASAEAALVGAEKKFAEAKSFLGTLHSHLFGYTLFLTRIRRRGFIQGWIWPGLRLVAPERTRCVPACFGVPLSTFL